MKIIEVTDKQTRNNFHKVAKLLYKDDNNWTCPLDAEIDGIFDPENNSCFKNGEAIRWYLVNDNEDLIGRISAFYDKTKINVNNDQPTGGIGFFECINDTNASALLFDTAKDWLKSKGIEAMDGPITFGQNITYWGLLIEGFMHQGYGMQYHFPYYKELFEAYGFQEYFQQYTYHKDLEEPFPERQEKFVRHIGEKPNYSFEHYTHKNAQKYIQEMTDIFNEVWSDFHEDYVPMSYSEVEKVFLDAKPIIDEDLIIYAYDEGKPIAMVVVLPDVNQVLKKLNGKLNIINKIRFVTSKKKINRARLVMIGVIPSHQRTFITGSLYMKMIDALKANGYKELEMGWIGDYNVTVNGIYSTLGTKIFKKHATYRYLFDRNAEFKRFTNETSDKMKKTLKNKK